jgi:DNA adenine methylase
MNLKPIIKTTNNKNYLISWVLEKFPENYREMTYVEPFVGSGGVFLAKEPSIEEVINDKEKKIIEIWQAIRDCNKEFCSKLKRIKYEEKTFINYKNKKEKDDLDSAVIEFVLRQMSKSGAKKTFNPKEKNIKKFSDCWPDLFIKIKEIEKRLKNTFILNMNAIELLNAFSNKNTLVYCDPPDLKNEQMSSAEHVELSECLNNFRGKVIISGQNNAVYKRLYKNWTRKSVPNRKNESIWINF